MGNKLLTWRMRYQPVWCVRPVGDNQNTHYAIKSAKSLAQHYAEYRFPGRVEIWEKVGEIVVKKRRKDGKCYLQKNLREVEDET